MTAKDHIIGCLLVLPLLVFHFLCFIVTLSMGIGVGILAAILHEICWDQKFYAFWQTYVTLVTVFIVIEIFFRVGFDTTLTNWMNRVQNNHRIELYYIPRGLYVLGYMAAVCLLYYAYQGAHTVIIPVPNKGNGNSTNSATTGPPPGVATRNSTFDGEGDVDPWKTNPLSLSPSADHFHYSLIFFIALTYMMYTLSKENDWTTHRRTVMESDQSDPIVRGGVGNFVVFLGSHVLMTFIYGLPLVGSVFLARQFLVGPILTFSAGIFMAILVGIAAIYIERRQPFPTEPMSPPAYAYENHLRIRLAVYQLWLLPFAAGRYFDANRSVALDAQNDDLLVFTVEVGIGIVQAIKIFGNDIFLLKAVFWPTKVSELDENYDLEENVLTNPLYNEESVISFTQSTQTLIFEDEPEPEIFTTLEKTQPNEEPAEIPIPKEKPKAQPKEEPAEIPILKGKPEPEAPSESPSDDQLEANESDDKVIFVMDDPSAAELPDPDPSEDNLF